MSVTHLAFDHGHMVCTVVDDDDRTCTMELGPEDSEVLTAVWDRFTECVVATITARMLDMAHGDAQAVPDTPETLLVTRPCYICQRGVSVTADADPGAKTYCDEHSGTA